MPLSREDYDQVDRLVNIIRNEASTFPFTSGGPKAYLHDWIMASKIPTNFKDDLSDGLSGDASQDARMIVLYAINKGINPAEPDCTVLGSMLKKLLDKLGVAANQMVLAILTGELNPRPASLVQPPPQPTPPQPVPTQKETKGNFWSSLRSKIRSPAGIVVSLLVIVGIAYLGYQVLSSQTHHEPTPSITQRATLSKKSVRPTTLPPLSPSFIPPKMATPVPTGLVIVPITPYIRASQVANPLPTLYKGQMVLIPAGSFTMGFNGGDDDEKPAHSVFLSDYYIDAFEVTITQYRACVENNVCKPPSSYSSSTRSNYYDDSRFDNYPVIFVTWEDAQTYCEWYGWRLPTEAEWEKAARGGQDGKIYPWGDDNPSCDQGAINGANFGGCSYQDTVTVGIYGPNGYGLYDMAGNVWEWVADWYDSSYYSSSPSSDPMGPQSGDYKVIRGGRWSSTIGGLRVAGRNSAYPTDSTNYGGFRCAASP